jgi:hypothetical protein
MQQICVGIRHRSLTASENGGTTSLHGALLLHEAGHDLYIGQIRRGNFRRAVRHILTFTALGMGRLITLLLFWTAPVVLGVTSALKLITK